ncbi:hypothetical protein [Veillonella magna]|uniref:hypothetical protein n=1 Tax=Veillonella magna TaxID=464322 RepID=UPI0026656EC3|nr:hypothetical protein [Veillonella magna]
MSVDGIVVAVSFCVEAIAAAFEVTIPLNGMAFEASLGRTTRIGAGIEALSLAVSVETVATTGRTTVIGADESVAANVVLLVKSKAANVAVIAWRE